MSEETKTQDLITFAEFKEMCEQAGISTDNLADLEGDYALGKVLAEVTDALMEEPSGDYRHLTLDDAQSRANVIGIAVEAIRTAASWVNPGEEIS